MHILVRLAVPIAFVSAVPSPTPLVIDSPHSNIGFAVSIMGGLSSVNGKFGNFAIDFSLDENNVEKSSINAVIEANSINTGIAGRDNHLRNADFLEVEKYPEITFKSSNITKKGKSYIVTGAFTMHGVTKEISFPFSISGKRVNSTNQTVIYGFTGKTSIKRGDYGVSYQRKDVPDYISNEITVEMRLLSKPVKL